MREGDRGFRRWEYKGKGKDFLSKKGGVRKGGRWSTKQSDEGEKMEMNNAEWSWERG